MTLRCAPVFAFLRESSSPLQVEGLPAEDHGWLVALSRTMEISSLDLTSSLVRPLDQFVEHRLEAFLRNRSAPEPHARG